MNNLITAIETLDSQLAAVGDNGLTAAQWEEIRIPAQAALATYRKAITATIVVSAPNATIQITTVPPTSCIRIGSAEVGCEVEQMKGDTSACASSTKS